MMSLCQSCMLSLLPCDYCCLLLHVCVYGQGCSLSFVHGCLDVPICSKLWCNVCFQKCETVGCRLLLVALRPSSGSTAHGRPLVQAPRHYTEYGKPPGAGFQEAPQCWASRRALVMFHTARSARAAFARARTGTQLCFSLGKAWKEHAILVPRHTKVQYPTDNRLSEGCIDLEPSDTPFVGCSRTIHALQNANTDTCSEAWENLRMGKSQLHIILIFNT